MGLGPDGRPGEEESGVGGDPREKAVLRALHFPTAARIVSASAAPSLPSSDPAFQPMPSPASPSRGMMWKWTWSTAWCAAAPLFWSTL